MEPVGRAEKRKSHRRGSLADRVRELGCGGSSRRERGESDKSWDNPPGVHMLKQATNKSSSCLMDNNFLSTLGIQKGETNAKDMDEGTLCILETEGTF